jgi:hypothetical protein
MGWIIFTQFYAYNILKLYTYMNVNEKYTLTFTHAMYVYFRYIYTYSTCISKTIYMYNICMNNIVQFLVLKWIFYLDRTFGVILKMIIWICKKNYFWFFPQKIVDTHYVCIAQEKIFV